MSNTLSHSEAHELFSKLSSWLRCPTKTNGGPSAVPFGEADEGETLLIKAMPFMFILRKDKFLMEIYAFSNEDPKNKIGTFRWQLDLFDTTAPLAWDSSIQPAAELALTEKFKSTINSLQC